MRLRTALLKLTACPFFRRMSKTCIFRDHLFPFRTVHPSQHDRLSRFHQETHIFSFDSYLTNAGLKSSSVESLESSFNVKSWLEWNSQGTFTLDTTTPTIWCFKNYAGCFATPRMHQIRALIGCAHTTLDDTALMNAIHTSKQHRGSETREQRSGVQSITSSGTTIQ